TWLSQLPPASTSNLPDSLPRQIARQCSDQAQAERLSEWRYLLLANQLAAITGAQSTCERIKATPLPFPYPLLLHRTSYMFCILLPFAM
uniref:bestrophin n=1 Tax=Pseudomonas protegens TaxID=380021 RepID=UPI0011CE9BAF